MDSHTTPLARRDIASVLHPYTNLRRHESQGPLVITRGDGIRVWDEAGREYIEALAGLWCVSLGFSEPRLVDAAARQMAKLPFYHSFAHKSHDVAIDLADRLLKLLPVPMSKVFFNNSGSEANDTAVKMVWYYRNALGQHRKKKILSRVRGYHGVTVATASLTGLPDNHRDFDLPIANVRHADCPHFYRYGKPGESEEAFASRLAESLEAQILREDPDTVAAFIAEPVQGAGGVIVPPRTYFEKIQAVLRKYDVLLIADEVICGFGRTGKMFGTETFGLEPDIMTMAKALSSGYAPISATVVNEKLYQAFLSESDRIGVFAHGYTYSNHPVPAAVALETLKIYEERRIVDHVNDVAADFQARLRSFRDHPFVGEVRGVGLIGAIELVRDRDSRAPFDRGLGVGAVIARAAQARGLIVRALGDTIAFCPPLVITRDEVREVFDRFGAALADSADEIARIAAAA
ncbi:MAG: aminotransferase class III-fold pyridoxal phosphate-dependent enzyme [Betaproteobacteria bacterium]|nr:aminotransferase class III-fold pyridoxal phosphate-dependent enzyme [Betaproteobacteria bacterium]